MFGPLTKGVLRDAGYSKSENQLFKTEPSDIWKSLTGGRTKNNVYRILVNSSRNMKPCYSEAPTMFLETQSNVSSVDQSSNWDAFWTDIKNAYNPPSEQVWVSNPLPGRVLKSNPLIVTPRVKQFVPKIIRPDFSCTIRYTTE
jgi:hypothetical protein